MFDPEEYGITTRRTVVDGRRHFEATVGELPDVVGYGATRAEAEKAVLAGIKGLQKAAIKRGKGFPPPVAPPSNFNGRVTLRLSKTIHQRAVFAASAEQVSLNSFITESVVERLSLGRRSAENAVDQAAFVSRAKKPSQPFNRVVQKLKRRGKLPS